MKSLVFRRAAHWLVASLGLAALALAAAPAQAAPWDGRRAQFADHAFEAVWSRTDGTSVRGGRSWYWGPGAWFDYAEFYRESPNGLRTVQYFDKARMEINNPNDRSYQNGVTNGLLVVELVSGRLKKGNNPYDAEYGTPAEVPVAGNPKETNPDAPTYASFVGVATVDNGYRDPNKLGQRVSLAIDKGGNISERPDLAERYPETRLVQYNSVTGHNIPSVLWDFMTLRGPVLEGGRVRQGAVIDWTFAMGLPITDAYWTRARVGDQDRDVLVQLFERRVLTYTPDNPAGYKVEMGNVGQHYFQWRYPHLGQPWATPDPSFPILYNASTGEAPLQIWLRSEGQAPWLKLTEEQQESVAFSYLRSFNPAKIRVLFDSRRGNGETRQIYAMEVPPLAGDYSRGPVVTRLTYSDGTQPPPNGPYPGWLPNGTANEYNPSASPDGTKVAFVSDRDGVPQIYLMPTSGNNPTRLTTDGCLSQTPSWSPDGRALYWERQCAGGKFTIMRANLAYTDDGQFGAIAQLANVKELTDQASDNRFPRVSPDGSKVAFTSYRDGNAEIYTMDANGGSVTRLTSSPAEDEAAAWRADGRQIAFGSNRQDGYKVWVMDASGANPARLTTSGDQERWPAWAQ